MKNILKYFFALALGCAFLQNPAATFAQEGGLEGIEEFLFAEIGPVYVSTKTATSIDKIPNKVVVFTEKDIKRRNYKFLGDIFCIELREGRFRELNWLSSFLQF